MPTTPMPERTCVMSMSSITSLELMSWTSELKLVTCTATTPRSMSAASQSRRDYPEQRLATHRLAQPSHNCLALPGSRTSGFSSLNRVQRALKPTVEVKATALPEKPPAGPSVCQAASPSHTLPSEVF